MRRPWVVRTTAAVAAVAACAAVALGVWATTLSHSLDSERSARAAEARAVQIVMDPARRRWRSAAATACSPSTRPAARSSSSTGSLPAPADKVYEAWVIPPGSKPIRAGIFKGGGSMTMVPLDADGADGLGRRDDRRARGRGRRAHRLADPDRPDLRPARAGRRYNPPASVLLRRKRSEPALPRRPRRRIRKLRLLALIGVLGVLGSTAFAYGLVVAVGQQLNGLDPFKQAAKQQVDGYVYAADGHTILAVLRGSQSRVLVQSDQISPWIKQAIVATEDRRFFEHRGIDIRGMGRALLADIEHKSAVQGGSTITQQFVKNELTGADRSITRKLKEATLAWQLEQNWSKDQILTAYLNTIYFANGAYGIERAARTYFGHNALKLTLPEAALLAGIPEDPSRYDPVAHPRAAKERRALVLRLMLQQGIIGARPVPPADRRRRCRSRRTSISRA